MRIQQGLQQWTTPTTGLYDVEVCGASGGDYATKGGKGAKVHGSVRLQQGTQLTLLIGQSGEGGGGGGGTFVVFSSNLTPLVVAGGGGGGGGLGHPGSYPDGDSGELTRLNVGNVRVFGSTVRKCSSVRFDDPEMFEFSIRWLVVVAFSVRFKV